MMQVKKGLQQSLMTAMSVNMSMPYEQNLFTMTSSKDEILL